MGSLKTNIISGLIWRFLERCGAQGISLVVSIILARILSPSEFGIVALVTAITNILMVFAESGLGQGLIQKKDANEEDFSTALIGNIFLAITLYTGVFIAAPVIAGFYSMSDLVLVIRVLGINILVGGMKGILHADIQRKMQFRKFFNATIIGTIISAFVGIFMAIRGMGVWALVFQQLTNSIIDTIFLWVASRYKFKWKFSFRRLKSLYKFSWKILASHFLDQIYTNVYSLIIGKVYTKEDLSYYNKGNGFPYYITNNLNGSIQMVMFPALASIQDNKDRVKAAMRKSMRVSAFVVFPMLAGFAAVAAEFISILLTDKWLACVPYLRFACFMYALDPIHTSNLEAIKAMGRSDIYFKLEIKKKAIGILLLLAALPHGLYAMMIGRCLAGICAGFINAYPNKKILNYGIRDQIRDLLPSFLLSIAMSACIISVSIFWNFNIYIKLIVEIFLGMLIYLAGAVFFKIAILNDIWILLKEMRREPVNHEKG